MKKIKKKLIKNKKYHKIINRKKTLLKKIINKIKKIKKKKKKKKRKNPNLKKKNKKQCNKKRKKNQKIMKLIICKLVNGEKIKTLKIKSKQANFQKMKKTNYYMLFAFMHRNKIQDWKN